MPVPMLVTGHTGGNRPAMTCVITSRGTCSEESQQVAWYRDGFPIAAVTNDHTFSSLKQHKFILSRFGRSEVKCVDKAVFALGVRGASPFPCLFQLWFWLVAPSSMFKAQHFQIYPFLSLSDLHIHGHTFSESPASSFTHRDACDHTTPPGNPG